MKLHDTIDSVNIASTTPSAIARTGVPTDALKSIPECEPEAYRRPEEDVIPKRCVTKTLSSGHENTTPSGSLLGSRMY